jgi:hypothetical protein
MAFFRWRKPQPTQAPAVLPIIATVPRSGTWFIRYSIAFYCHLGRGGQIRDRITGQMHGDLSGAPFDFERFLGGPLFADPAFPADRLFVGHTACPGFSRIAGEVPWWKDTPFPIPGYDYLHEGLDLTCTPTEFGGHSSTPLLPERLEEAAWTDARQRAVLVYREPVAQAESFFQFGKNKVDAHRMAGHWFDDTSFTEFLFDAALPCYAKQFVTYQKMAARLPDRVKLVPYEHLIVAPATTLEAMLRFLVSDASKLDTKGLGIALHLARQEHLQALERELGRSLDGTHAKSHIQRPRGTGADRPVDVALYERVAGWLAARGISSTHFVWPPGVPGAAKL